jgi:transposase
LWGHKAAHGFRSRRQSTQYLCYLNRTQGIICDQTIRFTGASADFYEAPMRKISYKDPKTKKRLTFLTNNFELDPKVIADLYKARWEVELFFKTLKSYLRVKKFVGTTDNAVKSQIWVALIAYLIMSIIKFENRLNW